MPTEYNEVVNVAQRVVCPSHPGEVLKELYLAGLKISITDLAKDIKVSRKAISAIVNGHKSVTAEMAMRLSIAMDTSPQFWLNLQANYDLWHIAREKQDCFSKIEQINLTMA